MHCLNNTFYNEYNIRILCSKNLTFKPQCQNRFAFQLTPQKN